MTWPLFGHDLRQETLARSQFFSAPIPAQHGGLTVASDDFMALMRSFEVEFSAIHGETLSYHPGAIKKVEERIQANHPDVGFPIVRAYCRGRVFLRLRFLNFRRKEIIAEEKRLKNQAKQSQEGAQRPKQKNQGGMPSGAQARNSRKRKEYQQCPHA